MKTMTRFSFCKLFTIFFCALNTGAFANPSIKIPKSKCSPIDIRDKMNPELKAGFSEPRDQKDIQWCYAFVASDLLSAEVGKMLSSAHVAFLYNEDVPSSLFTKYFLSRIRFASIYENGILKDSLEKTSKAGALCLEREFPYNSGVGKRFSQFLDAIEGAKESLKRDEYDIACMNVMRSLALGPSELLDFRNIYQELQHKEINQAMAEIATKHCADTLVAIPDLRVKSLSRPRLRRVNTRSLSVSKKEMLKRFEDRINNYFSKIEAKLSDGKPLAVEYDFSNVSSNPIGPSPHSSSVVGRRWRNGKCEFKIRNSFGTGCSAYNRSVISACEPLQGSFWLSDQKFYEIIKNVEYIELR